jgi:hypothetical protein
MAAEQYAVSHPGTSAPALRRALVRRWGEDAVPVPRTLQKIKAGAVAKVAALADDGMWDLFSDAIPAADAELAIEGAVAGRFTPFFPGEPGWEETKAEVYQELARESGGLQIPLGFIRRYVRIRRALPQQPRLISAQLAWMALLDPELAEAQLAFWGYVGFMNKLENEQQEQEERSDD